VPNEIQLQTRLARLAVVVALLTSFAQADHLEFNRDIRPILSDKCFACHGFDAKTREAGLRLDTPEGAYILKDGMAAIKPGDLDGSEVWHRVTHRDADEIMPPPESNKSLTAEEKKLLNNPLSPPPLRSKGAFKALPPEANS
jgi:hypothetical protein